MLDILSKSGSLQLAFVNRYFLGNEWEPSKPVSPMCANKTTMSKRPPPKNLYHYHQVSATKLPCYAEHDTPDMKISQLQAAGVWFLSCVIRYSTEQLQKLFFKCSTSLHTILSNCILP